MHDFLPGKPKHVSMHECLNVCTKYSYKGLSGSQLAKQQMAKSPFARNRQAAAAARSLLARLLLLSRLKVSPVQFKICYTMSARKKRKPLLKATQLEKLGQVNLGSTRIVGPVRIRVGFNTVNIFYG